MCSRRSAAACRRFSARGLAQQGSGNSRCAEAPGAARLKGQDRHRGRNLLPEIDRCENRRTRRRLCLSGQGQSEDTTPGHRNGFRRAGFSPCAHRSRCRKGAWAHRIARDRRAACRSRRDSRRVADGSADLSRHTFAPSREERRVAEATARGGLLVSACPPPPLATGVAGRQSQSLADRIMHRTGRHPRRGRLHKSLRQRSSELLSHRLRSQNPEIRGTLTNPRHRALSGRQKPRNPVVLEAFTESP